MLGIGMSGFINKLNRGRSPESTAQQLQGHLLQHLHFLTERAHWRNSNLCERNSMGQSVVGD